MLDRKGVNAVKVKINGIEEVVLIDNRVSLKKFKKEGETEVEITLINNLRNVLGPHHLSDGECYHVCPNSFMKEISVWNADNPEVKWNDGYCFVETGI